MESTPKATNRKLNPRKNPNKIGYRVDFRKFFIFSTKLKTPTVSDKNFYSMGA
jgi:hypothetical protein